MNADICVQVQRVERRFGEVQVLRGLDLTVGRGEVVALFGPSGSGKTTLLNLIGTLDRPTAGRIEVYGQDVLRMNERSRARLRRSQIGFIFQSATLLPTYSARENIDLALRLPGLGYFERTRRTRAALHAVGLSAWADHVPDELSGGQRQRVAVARALALRAGLVLADEPSNGLDTLNARRILAMFRVIAETQGTSFIIVSHDPMIVDYADAAYDLLDGRLVPRSMTGPAVPETPEGRS
jgi:ABC-type lipoprotein export system ATPase subunit